MKRSHGEGSIQPRGDAWRIRYRVNGQRFERTIQGSRSDAAKALREALKAGDDGKHVAPDKVTFGQWAKDWLALKERSVEGQTLDRYTELMDKHVLPVLGGHRLQAIRATDIDRLYGSIALAPRTMTLIHVVVNPDHAPRGPFLHLRAAHARRRPARPDRCAATHSATRLGLICLARRRTGARSPAAHALDGARRRATARNSRPSGQLVGNWIRMRARCSITRAPILIRRSRMVANSAFASGSVCGMASRTPSISQYAAV